MAELEEELESLAAIYGEDIRISRADNYDATTCCTIRVGPGKEQEARFVLPPEYVVSRAHSSVFTRGSPAAG